MLIRERWSCSGRTDVLIDGMVVFYSDVIEGNLTTLAVACSHWRTEVIARIVLEVIIAGTINKVGTKTYFVCRLLTRSLPTFTSSIYYTILKMQLAC